MRAGRGACWLAVFCVALAGCGSGAAFLTYDLRWVGTITPQDEAACGAPTQGTLTRRANGVTFTPNDGVLVISGTIDPSGHVHGALTLSGADHHPFPLVLDGTLAQDGFQGIYTTPRCQSQVRLHPAG